MKVLFVALFLCVVAVNCWTEYPKDGTWEEKLAYIKTHLASKLDAMSDEECDLAIAAGIKYLKGEGPKPVQLSALGEQLVSQLTAEQKQDVVAFLEAHVH